MITLVRVLWLNGVEMSKVALVLSIGVLVVVGCWSMFVDSMLVVVG